MNAKGEAGRVAGGTISKTRMKVALALSYFLFAILLNSVGTVILQAMAMWHIQETTASNLEAFKDLTIAFTSFLAAPFLPRLGYKKAILLGVAIATAGCLLMPLYPSFTTCEIMFFLCGLAFAFVKVSVYSSVALVTEDARHHAGFMSTIEGLYMVGMLSGNWIFSYFIDSKSPASPSWLHVYWLLTALGLIVFLLVSLTPFLAPPTHGEASLGKEFLDMVKLMAMPLVLVFIVSAFLYVLIEQGIGTWLPSFNSKVLGLPQAMAVQAASLYSAFLALGRLSGGKVIERWGWYGPLNGCLLVMAALIIGVIPLTYGLDHNPSMTWTSAPAATFLFPLIGLFMAPLYPALSSVMLSSLPQHQHASMTGLIVVFSALGGTTGSRITAYMFGHFSGQVAFSLILVPIAVIMITLAIFRRQTLALSPLPQVS